MLNQSGTTPRPPKRHLERSFTPYMDRLTVHCGRGERRITMQPDLPWNVAGIPPEAREAARASARREGLSVGEWLTRRILRSLSDMTDIHATPEGWRGAASAATPASRDTENMLANVSRSETETQNAYKR